MKKLFIVILISLTGTNMNIFSQENNQLMSVTIDSVKMIGDDDLNKVLYFYLTIKNDSSENLEFLYPSGYMAGNKEHNDWYMILKKDNKIQVDWDDSRFIEDRDFSLKFTIEKNTEFHQVFPIQLSSILVSGSRDNLSGNYTGQLELSTVKTKDSPRRTISSNIVEFEIK